MKRLLITAALLVCACTPPPAAEAPPVDTSAEPHLDAVTLPVSDAAGNHMEALSQNGDAWCSADALWCVRGGEHEWSVVHGAEVSALPVSGDGDVSVWPILIRTTADGAVHVGLVQSIQQMYSGGGASSAHVTIYEVTPTNPGIRAHAAATLPLSGSADIRACFDEDDEQQRARACSDQYTFVTRVSLDETVSQGAPRIVLETAAASYPGRMTRGADSLAAPPLQESDLVWARDETCTYRRVFSRTGAPLAGAYIPDAPLPPCTDYLEP